jgi:hypothetical protein
MVLQGQSSAPVREQKFSLSPALAAEVRGWAREHMQADPHGGGAAGDEYSIHSLYLDTENFDVLRRNGSFGRGKYRIRRYGASGKVFLERKMKRAGLISKRRTLVPIEEVGRTLTEPDRRWAGFWYQRRIQARGLQPVCQIQYSRTARLAALEAGNLRLTLDEGITACLPDGLSFSPRGEQYDVAPDRVILELKFRGRVPALAQSLIDQFGLHAQPSSKYRIAGALLGFPSELLALHGALGEAQRIEVPEFA